MFTCDQNGKQRDNHHHHVLRQARISLTLSLDIRFYHPSFPVGLQDYILCPNVVPRPELARPCEEAHRRLSLMSASLLPRQCPACLVCLIWIGLDMGGIWPYSCVLWDVDCRICSQ